MNNKIVQGVLVSVLVIVMAGCASVSREEIDQLMSDVSAASTNTDEAKQMAMDANATAAAAKSTADRALSTANEAKQMASDAQQQAGEAKSTAADTAEKTERMFKKSMSK